MLSPGLIGQSAPLTLLRFHGTFVPSLSPTRSHAAAIDRFLPVYPPSGVARPTGVYHRSHCPAQARQGPRQNQGVFSGHVPLQRLRFRPAQGHQNRHANARHAARTGRAGGQACPDTG